MNDITLLKNDLSGLETKLDYVDNQSRRNNVIFDNIPEASTKETWDETEISVKKIIVTNMGLKDAMPIERAHRIGKKRPDKPRPVVVKFLNHKDRQKVLSCGKNLKGSNVFVRDDVSERMMAKRSELYDDLKEARRNGKIAYFSLDKLVIKDRPPPEDTTKRNTRSQSTSQPSAAKTKVK